MPKSPQGPKSQKTAKRDPEAKPAKAGTSPTKAKSPRGAGSSEASVVPPVAPVKSDEGAKAKGWPKGGPGKADLKRYRQALLDLRATLLSSSKNLAAEALKASGQDFSVDHMADHGSDNYEQDFSLKLLEGETEQLADIREALMKIDGKLDPPFGLCEACADDALGKCESCPWIPASRLDVLPHARLCVQTKEMQERGRLS
jgi:DnaK suppressor protein